MGASWSSPPDATATPPPTAAAQPTSAIPNAIFLLLCMFVLLVSGVPPACAHPPEPALTEPFSRCSGREGSMDAVKLLLVEDDKKIATAVKRGLEAEGFTVDVSFDGTDGLWQATEHAYDLLVLDIMLPGRNGFQICADLR